MNLGIFNHNDPRDYLVGQSERMREVFDLVTRVARSDTTAVLITGESGTGKEVVAHAIHEQSAHSCGPFHALNCAAIANNLFESELFGYEPHAFTDAKKQKPGLLELAEGGTLFLDEIGEMPREMQPKLLRVLETRSFFRLGGTKEVRMKNVRVLAATNCDLKQAVQNGLFRSDLYFRLAVVKITLPPLRERSSDIPLFASRFLEDFNKLHGRSMQQVTPEAQRSLLAYSWPGNIRELRNVIEQAIILHDGKELQQSYLPQEIVSQNGQQECFCYDPWEQWLKTHPQEAVCLERIIERLEQYLVRWALEATSYNRQQAAMLLGLSKVEQLRYLMHKHGINTKNSPPKGNKHYTL
ncbi:MAG: sigma-54-dependent Fis family transcriptional regulator [Chloroflexi bacterium]|nr:sigma-54-dependent Fis family transcriptional regulator [Ktedonobacteraceae bacterium]MBV9019644.1 sigma-54-dependent Fis family transcriptional regulator [Ktedonobacteraceae bacterium]MBV9707778.1 sigma-54-dependent Fis family transcriptional regulator [Chloroflexota bacterium]